MAWIQLTPELLKTHLAKDEILALSTIQLPNNVDEIIADECTNVANAWRGKIRVFHPVDRRANYVPESLLEYILIHLRYACYTRLPAMGELLDELRRREWDRANDVMDNIKKFSIDDVEEGQEEEGYDRNPTVIINNPSWRFDFPPIPPPRPPQDPKYATRQALDNEISARILGDEQTLLSAKQYTDEHSSGGEFVPLSGNVMLSGNLSTDYDIYHRETKTVTFKNIHAENDTGEYFEDNVYVSYDASRASDLVTIDPSATIPITIKSKLVETGEDVTINAVLTSPEQYVAGQVKWNVTADGTTIGTIAFSENTPFPSMVFAYVHDDYIMSPVYIADTTEEVTVENPYIYDVGNLATKTEVRALKAQTLSSLGRLDNSITGLGNRITAVESNLDYSLSTGNSIHSRTVTRVERQSVNFVIFLSEHPRSGKVFDAIADVSNTDASPLSVTLDYQTDWRLAIDDGVDFNELMTIPAGTNTRFYFTQTRFTHDNKPVLHVSRKDIKFVEV
jgi:hypothetical protein